MDKVVVTGGAGFIGSHLCDRLLESGRRVICVDNFNDFYDPNIKRANVRPLLENPNFRLAEIDITDREGMEELFQEERPDRIVHLAARAGVRPSVQDPAIYELANGLGTLVMLELARHFEVGGFIFGSSSSVYGINSKVPFSPEDPISQPISPYAATKRAGELMCYTYNHLHGIPITCLRFFTVYGPAQRPEMAIHKFTRLIHSGKPIEVYGDGTSERDYTFITDIIDGVVAALERNLDFEILNLGNSKTVPLKYLVELIEKAVGKRAEVQSLPPEPGDVPITFADISKSRELLDFEPKVPIEEGVERFVGWYLQGL